MGSSDIQCYFRLLWAIHWCSKRKCLLGDCRWSASQTAPVQEYTRTIDGGLNWTGGPITNATGLYPSSICAIGQDTAWVAMFNPSGGAGAIWKQKMVDLPGHSSQPLPLLLPEISPTWCISGMLLPVFVWEILPADILKSTLLETEEATGHVFLQEASLRFNPGEFGITDVFTVRGNTLWFGTNLGRIYKSTDYGQSWTVATTPFAGDYIGSIAFRDENNGIAVSGSVGGPTDFAHHRRRSYMVFRRK